MNQKEIAHELALRFGPEHKPESLVVRVNQIVRGRRRLPADWESHLLSITGCKDRNELMEMFPEMKIDGASFNKPKNMFEVELSMIDPIGIVEEGMLNKIFQALRVLEEFGIKTEVRIRTNSKV